MAKVVRRKEAYVVIDKENQELAKFEIEEPSVELSKSEKKKQYAKSEADALEKAQSFQPEKKEKKAKGEKKSK